MRAWGRLFGRVVLILAVFVVGYLGAKLGLLDTREVRASDNYQSFSKDRFETSHRSVR